jgi:SAM-dependent methyltransferase
MMDPADTESIAPGGEAVWQDVECGSYKADLPLWRELEAAASTSGETCDLLELGCGTGRVSLDLAGRGCRVTGLDASGELVEALADRARELGVSINAVVADTRSFDLGRRFDLVLAPMQLAQLLPSTAERTAMLACVASHLKPEGRAAFALVDPEDEPGVGEPPPLPDMREVGGWVYASQPVAVRRSSDGEAIELERVRRAVAPGGETVEALRRDRLELVSCEELEREALAVGLRAEPRRKVPATRDHVASAVVVLRSDG